MRRPSINDIYDTLVAYIEGTLPSHEREAVYCRLQSSPQWRKAYEEVCRIHGHLEDKNLWQEISDPQIPLDKLWTNIISDVQRPTPRYHYWWKAVQLMAVITCIFSTLIMIPLLLGDATVNAQNNWSPNNPQNTNTYTATSENLYFSEVVKSEKTQEPRINTVRVIVIEFSLGAISHHATATMSHCDAMRFENEVSQAAAMSR